MVSAVHKDFQYFLCYQVSITVKRGSQHVFEEYCYIFVESYLDFSPYFPQICLVFMLTSFISIYSIN